MKVFVWEGDGISTGWHDDGTLAVIAETPEEARQIAIDSAPAWSEEDYGWVGEVDEHDPTVWLDGNLSSYHHQTPMEAIQRPPDRVVELAPGVVVFNGGGRD